LRHPGALAAQSLTKTFGHRTVLHGISLRVDDAERFVILGPSGAGKSTLLRALSGLEEPDSGSILVGGRDVTHEPPHRRGLALVFAHGALFPNMTVRENLAFAGRASAADVEASIASFALESLAQRRPAKLSGGERQRVAIARALLADPRALLLDEPLAQLDPPSREAIRMLLLQIARRHNRAVVIVTHDHEEALSTADRLAILIDGRIVQCDTPQAVYEKPASATVAKFLGPYPMNIIPSAGADIGIRPQDVRLNNSASDLEGTVSGCEFVGSAWIARIETRAGEVLVQHAEPMQEGERVRLGFPPERVRRFDPVTGDSIE
jgi:ABC-type sugar transport system ATPase subunit